MDNPNQGVGKTLPKNGSVSQWVLGSSLAKSLRLFVRNRAAALLKLSQNISYNQARRQLKYQGVPHETVKVGRP
jgi:hypothetical protein